MRQSLRKCIFLLCMVQFILVTGQDTLYFRSEAIPDTQSVLKVITRYSGDSVIVRWAPAKAADWLKLNTTGYIVRRYTLDREGLPVPESLRETEARPWTLEEFRSQEEQMGDYLLAAAQCLYGHWESAEDDQLNMYGRYQELENRFGVALLAADLDPQVANALGLRFVDTSIPQNRLFLYQVIPLDSTLRNTPGFSSILTVPEPSVQPVIDHLVEDEGYVNIKWRREDHASDFTAYWIEASQDGSTFTRLNTVPFVGGETVEYPSSYFSYKHLVDNYIPHHYRIAGLTPFGETSAPSEVRIGQARDRTPPGEPYNIEVQCDGTSSVVTLSWDVISSPDLEGIHILRAMRYDGVYQLTSNGALAPESVRFQEEIPDARMIWFYKVVSIDTAGNMNSSRIVQAAFRDTISPEIPTGLSGSIDSNGVVRLHWDRGTEPDLRGYYVYMANQADHYFTNMTPRPVADTTWTDTITLRTFTEQIYYKVAAVDFHAHFSEWTEPLALSKPDTIRPFPPSFTAYRVEKDHILLHCAPSKSKDVVRHELQRRMLPGGDWTGIDQFQINNSAFEDFTVEPDASYEYRLTAIDDAGLTNSEQAVLRVKFVDQRRPQAPTIATVDHAEQSIELTIDQIDDKTTGIIVYRSVNAGPFTTLSRLSVQDRFRDTSLRSENQYAYRIKAVWSDGQKSDFSNTITSQNTQ